MTTRTISEMLNDRVLMNSIVEMREEGLTYMEIDDLLDLENGHGKRHTDRRDSYHLSRMSKGRKMLS